LSWQVHVFGIRHLSPMGAWHLRAFLDQHQPDVVLIEGIDDATPLIPDIARTDTKPPLAILAYTDTLPMRTIVTPFASYSPEYQALLWAAQQGARAEFFDLPSECFLGLIDAEYELRDKLREVAADKAKTADSDDSPDASSPPVLGKDTRPQRSLYQRIADQSDEHDFESFWERRFEHNLAQDCYRTTAFEFGQAARELEEDQPRWRAENLIREAYMRRRIEAELSAGVPPEKIVAVCGAFHAPVLHGDLPAMTDAELASLRRRSSTLTLMPYSYFKLSSQSGYGAGNQAPAYFQLLWEALGEDNLLGLSHRYLAQVAQHLRDLGTHRSTAEVIEAVRLAQTMSALKRGLAPTLADLRDAATTLLGQGHLNVVSEALARLDVGTEIGALPDGVSQTSIQADFERELTRLK